MPHAPKLHPCVFSRCGMPYTAAADSNCFGLSSLKRKKEKEEEEKFPPPSIPSQNSCSHGDTRKLLQRSARGSAQSSNCGIPLCSRTLLFLAIFKSFGGTNRLTLKWEKGRQDRERERKSQKKSHRGDKSIGNQAVARSQSGQVERTGRWTACAARARPAGPPRRGPAANTCSEVDKAWRSHR